MTDKMPEVIYVFPDEKSIGDRGFTTTEKEKTCEGLDYTPYIRQDSINVPDGLDGTLEGFKRNGIPAMIGFEPIYKAALELQRLKGLK